MHLRARFIHVFATISALLSLLASGCVEPPECQHEPPPEGHLVLAVYPKVTSEEEAAFNRAAAKWASWTDGKAQVSLDRNLPYGDRPTFWKIAGDAWINEFDAETGDLEDTDDDLYAAETEFSVWFLPSRVRPDQLETVLTHEIGHALGLGHVDERGAVMYQNPKRSTGELKDIDRRTLRVCFTEKLAQQQ